MAANRPVEGIPTGLAYYQASPVFIQKKLTTHRHTDHITPLSNLFIMQEINGFIPAHGASA
jgi:hypothetical protein